jgi:hypothetical protein
MQMTATETNTLAATLAAALNARRAVLKQEDDEEPLDEDDEWK